jgi:hypothetical protein
MARFAVRLTARGGADRVDRVGEDGTLHVRVAAPAVEGAANAALCRLLAGELGIPSRAVRVVRGATARRKLVEVDVDPARVAAAWPGVAAAAHS